MVVLDPITMKFKHWAMEFRHFLRDLAPQHPQNHQFFALSGPWALQNLHLYPLLLLGDYPTPQITANCKETKILRTKYFCENLDFLIVKFWGWKFKIALFGRESQIKHLCILRIIYFMYFRRLRDYKLLLAQMRHHSDNGQVYFWPYQK